jgi:hypothetical protein
VPLIKDPAIQNALTDKITNQIVTRINVAGLTDQAAAALAQKGLPRVSALLRGVAGSLASGVAGFVHRRIHKIITGPRMANAWTQVNRVASQQLIAVLSGRATSGSGAVGVSSGQVILDLAPLIAVAKQDLVARDAGSYGGAFPGVFSGPFTAVLSVAAAGCDAGSRTASRSAANTFCSMCQSSGCCAMSAAQTVASCWVIAATFCGGLPASGTGISG